MATIMDVAKEAEVSPATVSRVINNSMLVSDEKKQKVYEAMERVGYVIPIKNRASRAANGKLLLTITNMSRYSLFEGMQQSAADLGYGLVLLQMSDSPEGYSDAINTIKLIEAGGQLAGMLLVNHTGRDSDFENMIRNYPVIYVGEASKSENQSLVSIDDYQAAYDLTSHLISQGRKRIAIYATKQPENRGNFESQRIRGYRAALMDNGIIPTEELVRYSDFTSEGAVYTTRNMLKSMDTLPDAIVCLSDIVAYGCMRTLIRKGVSVPDDIAVVGMDDERESEYMTPSLTSIAQDFGDMGRESVRLMHSLIGGEMSNGRKVFVSHRLVVRESSTKLEL